MIRKEFLEPRSNPMRPLSDFKVTRVKKEKPVDFADLIKAYIEGKVK